jgi:opacity protein-like surface antigen
MEIKLRIFLTGLILFCASSITFANDTYVSLKFGASVVEDNGISDPDVTLISDIEYGLDFGHAVSGAFGIQCTSCNLVTRGEIEVANQINDVETLSGVEVASGIRYDPSISGADLSVTTILANVYKDFTFGYGLSSYLTGGLGVAVSEVEVDAGATATYGNTILTWNELREFDDTVFAWQVGTGFGYDLTRSLTIDVGYRYLGTSDFTFHDNTDVEFGSHNVTGGIRYSF